MGRKLNYATFLAVGRWLAYVVLVVLGFWAGRASWALGDSLSRFLPDFPGPIAPGAVGIITTQLYGMILLLLLLILFRRFFPKAAVFFAVFTIGFTLNVLFVGMLGAYVHLYDGGFYGPVD